MFNSKRLMMSSAIASGPQEIAPSSNDWDYTFSQNEWAVSGNSLGDNTIGGTVDNIGSTGDSGVSSLTTFDGDFIVSFTLTTFGTSTMVFGCHAIAEDGTRAANQHLGKQSMTNSYWYQDSGAPINRFMIGGSSDSGVLEFANGDDVIFTRESGTMTVQKNGSLFHTYSSTFSGPVRFELSQANVADCRFSNILFTDTDKIQRDGFLNEGLVDQSGFGEVVSNGRSQGTEFIATRSGYIETITMNLRTVSTSFNAKCELWSSDGTSPVAQIGTDSDTVNLNSTGEKTFTFPGSDAVVEKGAKYWWVTTDTDGGSGIVNPQHLADSYKQGKGTGRHDTITSITGHATASVDTDRAAEIKINTSDGEPTPGHGTLFLLNDIGQSDESTTLVESSQFARTITVAGSTKWDSGQTLFGGNTLYFDGTGPDYFTIPDSSDWTFSTKNYAVGVWVYPTETGSRGIMGQGTSGSWGGISLEFFFTSGKFGSVVSNGGGTGLTIIGTSAISTSAWTHCMFVRAGNKHSLYVGGVEEASNTTDATPLDVASPWAFGREYATFSIASRYYYGYMAQPVIFNYAPYDANFTPPSAPYPS